MRSLAETLRHIRGVRGYSLREVEKETGISNAYLSQLENGNTLHPSPHVLQKLAGYYEVPYESLMADAGYLQPAAEGGRPKARASAIEAALMTAKLTDDEQLKVAEFIEFLRSQRRQRKK